MRVKEKFVPMLVQKFSLKFKKKNPRFIRKFSLVY